jgi:hypothetical protein
MRTRQQNREYIRQYRYKKKLAIQKLRENVCHYCGSQVETLHHINENHSDSNPKNLLPLCNKCHLEVVHTCDKPNYYNTEVPEMPRNRVFKPKEAVTPKRTLKDILDNCNSRCVSNINLIKTSTSKKIHIIEGSKHLLELFLSWGYEII